MREASENTPEKTCPHIAIRIEKPGNAGLKCSGRVHAVPLTNEFGQVQVKCSRKKPTWPSGRRNGIWVAGRPRAPLFLSLSSLPLPFSLSHLLRLAGYCLRFPINERVPPHDPHHRALSTVMVFRAVLASPARCILAKCTDAAEMCCAKRWAGWKAGGIRENVRTK